MSTTIAGAGDIDLVDDILVRSCIGHICGSMYDMLLYWLDESSTSKGGGPDVRFSRILDLHPHLEEI